MSLYSLSIHCICQLHSLHHQRLGHIELSQVGEFLGPIQGVAAAAAGLTALGDQPISLSIYLSIYLANYCVVPILSKLRL